MPDVLCLYPGTAALRQQAVADHRELLDSLGLRLILADDAPDARDAEHFAEVHELPPADRAHEAWAALRARFDGRALHGILAQSEAALGLGALFAAERRLPGPPPAAALATCSKLLSRRALERARVPQPRFALARDADGVRRFAAEVGWPVVLKAAASVRSQLVAILRGPAEVEPAVERMLHGLAASPEVRRLRELASLARVDLGAEPAESFLVEEFARGDPVETDGVLRGTEVVSYGVLAQRIPPPPRFYLEGYLLGADLPRAALAEIERTSAAALAAIGLATTGYSIEMRHDAGKAAGSRARVIEVNGRLGADEGFGDLFEAVLGAHPMLHALQLALGAPLAPPPRADGFGAVAYAACYEERIVSRVPTASELADACARHGVRASVVVQPGTRMHRAPSPNAMPHLAWCLAQDPRSSTAAYARAREAVDELRFELETPR